MATVVLGLPCLRGGTFNAPFVKSHSRTNPSLLGTSLTSVPTLRAVRKGHGYPSRSLPTQPPVKSTDALNVAQLKVSRQKESEESQRVGVRGDDSGSTRIHSVGENLGVQESKDRVGVPRPAVAKHDGFHQGGQAEVVDMVQRSARLDQLLDDAVMPQMRCGDQGGAVVATGEWA